MHIQTQSKILNGLNFSPRYRPVREKSTTMACLGQKEKVRGSTNGKNKNFIA